MSCKEESRAAIRGGGYRTPLRSAIANCTSALAAALTFWGLRGWNPLGEGVRGRPGRGCSQGETSPTMVPFLPQQKKNTCRRAGVFCTN